MIIGFRSDIEMMPPDQKPRNFVDYLALTISTCGVGFIPGAPGTYGSIIGILLYFPLHTLVVLLRVGAQEGPNRLPGDELDAWFFVGTLLLVAAFILVGIWASTHSAELLDNDDPHQVVVDEVMGQIVTLLFIPFTTDWRLILAGFVLFRLFDIWKPYPIDNLQQLPKGLGICADDLVAGVYAGICLSIIYAVILM